MLLLAKVAAVLVPLALKGIVDEFSRTARGSYDQSIAYNVAYGRLDATVSEIIEASKAAQVHEFIVSLPPASSSRAARSSASRSRALLKNLHCGCRILGDGIEAGASMYCCGHCAHGSRVTEAVDNAAHA
ncbi:MAG TPA: hypothetical protein VFK10_10400 [Burkholderiaceae bacterium]|nr:hypothetical protein [Burkholderiaceae bacterium]